jgi:hypothetical protein
MAKSIIDFLSGYNVRVTDTLDAPVMTATVQGTAGTTTYTYKVSFVTLVGQSLCSDEVSVTTGNATLNGFNKNLLSVVNIPESVTYVRYWKKVSDTWYILADVTAAVGQLYDIGQSTTAASVPTTNTSGRPGVIAVGLKPGQLRQRITDMDLQAIIYRKDQALWDTIFRDGDIRSGCKEILVSGPTRVSSTVYAVDDIITIDKDSQFRYKCTTSGTTASSDPGSWPTTVGGTKTDGDAVFTCFCDYTFTSGTMYLLGVMVDVPGDTISLTGSGTEVVGVTIEPLITTADEDIVQRANIDERCPAEAANTGPDWIYLQVTWVKDTSGQIKVKEFLDGIPKLATIATQRSALEIELARQRYDTSGNFVVQKFPLQVFEHDDDDTKLLLSINRGKAYPSGYEVQFEGNRKIEFDKARETKTVNNSGTDVFDCPGGYTTGTVVEGAGGFDVSGKAIKLKVGSGNYHTVTFAANDLTAAQVCSYIESEVNSYGSEDLVNCVAGSGLVQVQAAANKSLEIAAVANDAYTLLGISTGTYEPIGTRVYEINNAYVKTVTDLSYKIEEVLQVTHNGTTHKDLLGESIVSIVGASITQADCHDSKFDYEVSVDYQKDGNYIDFTLGGDEPTGGSTYYVKAQRNYNATLGSRILIEVVDAKIVKGVEDGIDVITYTDATSITKVSNGASVSLTGNASDVIEVLRINNSTGQSVTQYTSYEFYKNSGALSNENSTIDWSNAGQPGVVITGQPYETNTYYISFRAWYHAVEGDLLTADSYDLYEEIETYSGLNLRDCLDFRTEDGVWPVDGEDPTFDYEFYLSRIDKLTLDDLGNFKLITGAAAINPPTPMDQSGVQSLAVLRIAPYTYSTSEVQVVSLEVMRLTQQQLQNVPDRVTRLEYWAAVNDLEKEANNKLIYATVGGESVAAEKQGIFTDALTGFGRCDLQYDREGVSFTSAIDTVERCIRLQASKDLQVIEVDMDNSVSVREAGNSIMLDYQPELVEEQPYAGITVNGASDFVVTDYYGHLKITPETDVFMDENQMAAVNIDFDNNLTALTDSVNTLLANNINWGNWSNGVPGAGTFGGDLNTTRTGMFTQLIPGSITQSLGDRVVDLSLQGMMRAGVTISCDVVGLLPNVDHAVTMNGIACDLTYDASPVNKAGAQGTNTYLSKTTVRSSNDGCLTATFLVPSGIPIGNAVISIFYYNTPAISFASASYYTAGFMQTNQETTVGLPTTEIQTSATTQSGRLTLLPTLQGDFSFPPEPLAQSFILSEPAYISEVHLAFATKHATMGYTVQIRNMVNGYPGSIIHATKHLDPADITLSTDSSVYTEFAFDNVLQYAANVEYCFVGIPDQSNTGYNLFAFELSTVDMITGARLVSQNASGVLFHSPNNTTWEPWTKRDLKYKIYKSNFDNSCQIYWKNLTGVQASILVLAVQEFLGSGTNAIWSYSLDEGVSWIPFRAGINTDLGEIITQIQLRVDVTSLGGNYQVVDKFAGILLLYHDAEGWYIGNDEIFTDALTYPNKITVYLDIDAYGTNGAGITSVTPYASIDDGITLFELTQKIGYTAIAASVEP